MTYRKFASVDRQSSPHWAQASPGGSDQPAGERGADTRGGAFAAAGPSGVSRSAVEATEAGRTGRVRYGTMETLADALGVEPEEIDDFSPSSRPRRRTPGGAGTA